MYEKFCIGSSLLIINNARTIIAILYYCLCSDHFTLFIGLIIIINANLFIMISVISILSAFTYIVTIM